MTGPQHYAAAERVSADALGLLSLADEWMDADVGWRAHLPAEERVQRRAADIAEAQVLATLAQVHATLAVAAAQAPVRIWQPQVPSEELGRAWAEAVS